MGRLRSPSNSMNAPTKSIIPNTSGISTKSAPNGLHMNVKWSPDHHITSKMPPTCTPQKQSNSKAKSNHIKKMYQKPKIGKVFNSPSPAKKFFSQSQDGMVNLAN